MAIGLAAVVATYLPFGCDTPPAQVASFGLGYLVGRWEATRVERVTTERSCYQDGVPVACP